MTDQRAIKSNRTKRQWLVAGICLVLVLSFWTAVFIALLPDDLLTKEEMKEIMKAPPETYPELLRKIRACESRSVHERYTKAYTTPLSSRSERIKVSDQDGIEWFFQDPNTQTQFKWRPGFQVRDVQRVYVITTVPDPEAFTPRVTSTWSILVSVDDRIIGWWGRDEESGARLH